MKSEWKSSVSRTDEKRISSKALFALVFYLILPTAAILMMIAAYPELSRNRLLGILARTVPIGIALVFVSQFGVRYEKGSRVRFILSETYVVLVLLWLFALLGGEPVIHQTWEEYHFSLNIWNYLLLIFFVTSINVIYYIAEFQAYRRKNIVGAVENDGKTGEDAMEHKGITITTLQVE